MDREAVLWIAHIEQPVVQSRLMSEDVTIAEFGKGVVGAELRCRALQDCHEAEGPCVAEGGGDHSIGIDLPKCANQRTL